MKALVNWFNRKNLFVFLLVCVSVIGMAGFFISHTVLAMGEQSQTEQTAGKSFTVPVWKQQSLLLSSILPDANHIFVSPQKTKSISFLLINRGFTNVFGSSLNSTFPIINEATPCYVAENQLTYSIGAEGGDFTAYPEFSITIGCTPAVMVNEPWIQMGSPVVIGPNTNFPDQVWWRVPGNFPPNLSSTERWGQIRITLPNNASTFSNIRQYGMPERSIYGRISSPNGYLAGVVVTATKLNPTFTYSGNSNNGGAYLISGPPFQPLPLGDYTVTPSKPGYTFNPPSRTISNQTTPQVADFTAIPVQPNQYDLTIQIFEPVQAVYYPSNQPVQLVKGKATAAKVVVRIDNLNNMQASHVVNGTVELLGQGTPRTFECNRNEFVAGEGTTGLCTEYVQLPSPTTVTTSPIPARVTVTATPAGVESNTANNEANRAFEVKDTGALSIKYVPVFPPRRGPFISYPYPTNVQSTIDVSNDFIKKVFPLDPSRFIGDWFIGEPFVGSINHLDVNDDGVSDGIYADLFALHFIANQTNRDRVIGIVSPLYFRFHRERDTLGIMMANEMDISRFRSALAVSVGSSLPPYILPFNRDGAITAHEIGHTYGLRLLNEEYKVEFQQCLRHNGYSPSDNPPSEVNNRFCFMNADYPELNPRCGTNLDLMPRWVDFDDYDLLRRNLINRPIIVDPPQPLENTAETTSLITNSLYPGSNTSAPYLSPKSRETNKQIMIGALLNSNGEVKSLRWLTTSNKQLETGSSELYKVRTFDIYGNILSENPANVGFRMEDMATNGEKISKGLLADKLPFVPKLATIEILHKGKVIARYPLAAKFLRDAIEGIPNLGFVSVPDMFRRELLEKIDVIEKLIEEGKEQEALRVLEDELKPRLQIYLPVNYTKETFLQFERPEVFAAVDLAAERLNLQIKQRAEGK